VLATIDGSPVSPSAAVVNSNRYEIRYVDAVADFCASGIPAAAAVATLTSQYGRQARARRRAASPAPIAQRRHPAAVRYEGEQRRRALIANYTKALADHGVDFMLVLTLGDVIGKRAGGGPGFPTFRAYYQVPTRRLADGQLPGRVRVGPARVGQFWGPRFSEPGIVAAALDYQANFPEYNHAAPTDRRRRPRRPGRTPLRRPCPPHRVPPRIPGRATTR